MLAIAARWLLGALMTARGWTTVQLVPRAAQIELRTGEPGVRVTGTAAPIAG